jgi:hypothetical protein
VVAATQGGKSLTYGTIGNGSLGHLAVTLLARSAGLDLVHVPYKGGGPLMQDAIAGHVPLSIGSVFVAKPHIDSGRIRPLAVTTAQRNPALPEVPTLAELGFANFEAPAWWAVIAPAKTPRRSCAHERRDQQGHAAARGGGKLAQQGIVVNIGTPAAGAGLRRAAARHLGEGGAGQRHQGRLNTRPQHHCSQAAHRRMPPRPAPTSDALPWLDAAALRAAVAPGGGCAHCAALVCPGWESVPGPVQAPRLEPVGTLRGAGVEEPTLAEHHPAGTHYWDARAPVATAFSPTTAARSGAARSAGAGSSSTWRPVATTPTTGCARSTLRSSSEFPSPCPWPTCPTPT